MSRLASSASESPATSRTFSRPCSPLSTRTAEGDTPRQAARRRQTDSLALPSTGAAVVHTATSPLWPTRTASRAAFGRTRIHNRTMHQPSGREVRIAESICQCTLQRSAARAFRYGQQGDREHAEALQHMPRELRGTREPSSRLTIPGALRADAQATLVQPRPQPDPAAYPSCTRCVVCSGNPRRSSVCILGQPRVRRSAATSPPDRTARGARPADSRSNLAPNGSITDTAQ